MKKTRKINVDRMSIKRILEEVEKDWERLGFTEDQLPTLRWNEKGRRV